MQRFCPACPLPLTRFSLKGQQFHACGEHGILVNASVLSKFFKSPELVQDCISKLRGSREEMRESHRRCPECHRGLFTFVAHTFAGVQVDVCQKCKVYWFDQGEWEAVKDADFQAAMPAEAAPKVSGERYPTPSRKRDWLEVGEIPHWSGALLPSEDSDKIKIRPPILTFAILFFSLVTTALAFKQPGLFNKWLYFPEHPFNPVPHLMSLFIHAGYLHWLGNALYLYIAGDDVEDEVGHWEFAKLFVLSGVAGHFAYSWMGAVDPSLGMSGAVSGLIAYYGIRFPNHTIGIPKIFWWGGTVHMAKIRLTASTVVAIYVTTNVVGFYLQTQSGGGVNYAAHLGGLALGAVYALLTEDNRVS